MDERASNTVQRVEADGRLVPAEWTRFAAERAPAGDLYWVDIEGVDPIDLAERFASLQLDPIVLERCLDPASVSGVAAYDGLLTVQLPVARDWESSAHPKLTILSLSNAVISILPGGSVDWAPAVRSSIHTPGNRAPDVPALLFALLDGLVDRTTDLTLQARGTVDKLEDEMERNDDDRFGTRVLHLKRAIAHFEMALEAKHRTLTALLSQDVAGFDLHAIREPLRDAAAHLEHSLRYVERMEDHLSELHQHYLLVLQDRPSNRLRILTILSAIFMPLTLVAGIYGMNFSNMPELGWRYGDPVVLLMMVGLALSLLCYFYRKGWFR